MRVTIVLLMTLLASSCAYQSSCTLDPGAEISKEKVNPKATVNCNF